MDTKSIAKQIGEAGLVICLFLAFLAVICVLFVFFGPTAPKPPDLSCSLVNNATFCHL
jgi:hypothetical protein